MISYGSNRADPSPLAMVAPVSRELIGPSGNQVSGVIGDEGQAPGPGSVIDSAIADHEQRISALELGEAGEGAA